MGLLFSSCASWRGKSTNLPTLHNMTTTPPAWLAPATRIIQEFEGCRLEAYPDPGTGGDPWTIGWGSTRYYGGNPVKRGDKISQEVADAMLAWTIERTGAWLAQRIPGWARMNANQQAALISFSYNVGPNWFEGEGFRTISRTIREGRLRGVPAVLKLYVNPGSPAEEGLRRRRQAEAALFTASGGV